MVVVHGSRWPLCPYMVNISKSSFPEPQILWCWIFAFRTNLEKKKKKKKKMLFSIVVELQNFKSLCCNRYNYVNTIMWLNGCFHTSPVTGQRTVVLAWGLLHWSEAEPIQPSEGQYDCPRTCNRANVQTSISWHFIDQLFLSFYQKKKLKVTK